MRYAVFANLIYNHTFTKLFNAEVPIRAAYKMSKIQKAMQEENERYNTLRLGIIKKHAELDSEGNVIANEADNSGFVEFYYTDTPLA